MAAVVLEATQWRQAPRPCRLASLSKLLRMVYQAINPSTGLAFDPVPLATAEQVEASLSQAEHAAAGWRATDYTERAAILNRCADELRRQAPQLAELMADEMGKPLRQGLAEIEKSAACAEHYATHAADYLADEIIESDAAHSFVRYLPLGPLLTILPWNMPIWLAMRSCAPALMAGNVCIVKPDPHTPACGQAWADLWQTVLSASTTNNAICQTLMIDTDVIKQVIADPRIRGVTLTGSSAAGAAVAEQAGKYLKPAVLELGGSDPSLILADADLERAVATIVASRLNNNGQSCIAAKRIIVVGSIYDHAVEQLTSAMAAHQPANPRHADTTLGPLARDDLRQLLHQQITASINAGAECALGGFVPDGPGWFYPPTVLTNCTPAMTCCAEETFGPVLAIMRATDDAHAVSLANATAYGLGASLWTEQTDHALRLSAQIDCGQVAINGLVKTDPRLPSGGCKASGIGRELGSHGIRAVAQAQQVWVGQPATR